MFLLIENIKTIDNMRMRAFVCVFRLLRQSQTNTNRAQLFNRYDVLRLHLSIYR